ncbi:MAG: hypothetical protein ACK49N_14155 [Verrucomicrobiota bacterium]
MNSVKICTLTPFFTLSDEELPQVLEATSWYSNRDIDFLIREIKSVRRERPEACTMDVLQTWSASKGIVGKRAAQSIIAASTSSYPSLVPDRYKAADMDDYLRQARMILQA